MVDGRGEDFPSQIQTLASLILLICHVYPPNLEWRREGSCRALGQLLQLRISVMHILLTVASLLGAAYWSVTENLVKQFKYIDQIWLWNSFEMDLDGNVMWYHLGFSPVWTQSGWMIWHWQNKNVIGAVHVDASPVKPMPNLSGWKPGPPDINRNFAINFRMAHIFLLSWVSISSSLISRIISQDRTYEEWIVTQIREQEALFFKKYRCKPLSWNKLIV